MQKYVVCLLFNESLSQVCLIEKSRPDWQVGLLNGPGGKVEPGETYLEAATREFREETGVGVYDWKMLCTKRGKDESYEVAFLVRKDTELLSMVRTMTDEQVGVRDIKYIDPTKLVSSIEWVLPLALYSLAGKLDNELIWVQHD